MFIQYKNTLYNLNRYSEISKSRHRNDLEIVLFDNEDSIDKLIFTNEEERDKAFESIAELTNSFKIK